MDNTLFIYAPKAIIAPKWAINDALQCISNMYSSGKLNNTQDSPEE